MQGQKIIPHLWFDTEAKEAAQFYVSIFPDSKIDHVSVLQGTPSGDCDVVSFTLSGYSFMSISAGPYFKLNPSISFFVNFDPAKDADAESRLDVLWKKLLEGGTALMDLQEYPFSKKYGWVQDRYGVSWQLILTDPDGDVRPFIVPSLLFANDVYGKAEEASDFYLSVFNDSQRGLLARYPAGLEPDGEGTLMFTDFRLAGQWFAAMDSAQPHRFGFNEALSFLIYCDDQEEVDYYWEKLSAVPEAEMCGWLKDKYGVSWQIYPKIADVMLREGTAEQVARVTEAFLQMKKFDIPSLEEAFRES